MSDRDLYQLAYISTSPLPLMGHPPSDDLNAILEVSRLKNDEKEITGALLYSVRHFGQIIEGPKDAIAELYATICKDERHEDVHCLMFEPTPERHFADWSMAFAFADKGQGKQIENYLLSTGKMDTNEQGHHFLDLMLNLLGKRDRREEPMAAVQ